MLKDLAAHDNGDSGVILRGAGSDHNLVRDVDSYANHDDSTGGSRADGIALTHGSGRDNRIVGARVFNNSDDGMDLWNWAGPVVIDHSWAYGNGRNRWRIPTSPAPAAASNWAAAARPRRRGPCRTDVGGLGQQQARLRRGRQLRCRPAGSHHGVRQRGQRVRLPAPPRGSTATWRSATATRPASPTPRPRTATAGTPASGCRG
ncbi:right-handed parallel beta-helix repeat-containing protein [Streptomyces sp. M19]